MKDKKLELKELEEIKNLLINQLNVFAKKHQFNNNDFLETYLKEEVDKFIKYGLNLPYHCANVDLKFKIISQLKNQVIKDDKSCSVNRQID